jgi:endo-1,4-beta-xylanase
MPRTSLSVVDGTLARSPSKIYRTVVYCLPAFDSDTCFSFSRTVTYGGQYQANGGTVLLSLYGWSTNPLVEYYVQDDYQGGSAGQGTHKGTLTSDGATYDVYEHTQNNQPSIQGTSTFNQYISVRSSGSKRSNGTITFANHVAAWKGFGMNLGTMNYQVIATEGWGGASGSASLTVSGSG